MNGRLNIRRVCVGLLGIGLMLCASHIAAQQTDTTAVTPRYPVARTQPEAYEELTKRSPADLRSPENVTTKIDYDVRTGMYIVRTRVGDMELGTPLVLTPKEYRDYSLQESVNAYYREKNSLEAANRESQRFNPLDIQFNLGPADRIFGKGGVRIKSQGSAELSVGLKSSGTKNPSLPERTRNRTFFNFDNNVQLNMQATVGTKVGFNLNYNTQSSFDFDASRLKLGYTGEEDEIVKVLEAGDVSLNTSNSLIRGGAALFGIRTELQFGKLRVNALLAQQNSESQSVSTRGGAQTRLFELTADQYEEDRHFFLGYYFRNQFDHAMSKLPYIASGVRIEQIEVWVTNRRGNYTQARNIVAFADLGEADSLYNSTFRITGMGDKQPSNASNRLYEELRNYGGARTISSVRQTLEGFLEAGIEYEDIESARKLEPSEYTLHPQLGYISLNMKLQPEEALAVAYRYSYGGEWFQVGEFSNDRTENTDQTLYVKLLKGTTMSPSMPFWDLMMKNIYSLGAYSVQKDRFRLDVLYQSDTAGTYVNYLPEGAIANKVLLQVMNLDRLDINNEPHPNGFFDFVEGLTVIPASGRIVFPVVEPFGAHLASAIGNQATARKYAFHELYDSTKTIAQQIAEKNKFILRGEYKASSGSEIMLGATNVARGSVVVTAGGNTLTENIDYTVDYVSGIVTILNENLIASNTPIRVSLENRSTYSMQRKTMMGVNLQYDFSRNFTAGATLMHLSEMPITTKTALGEESIRNTLWGANIAYQGESQWLTNVVNNIPLLNLTQPSRIAFNAEFAHLIAGHYENKHTGGYSYLDDFESTQSSIDLLNPYPWALASTPYDKFPEAAQNGVDYGRNRALLAWYYIDGLFTRSRSNLRPGYLNNDEVISDHRVRAVNYRELFPMKDQTYGENSTLYVLNLAYYPNERGPYNLDTDGMNPDGSLTNPETRWGGMMRKLERTDFEQANVEYIEFWMMDPFIYNRNTASGGDLYFNLGDISEDILKDERKFFENGLPVDGNVQQVDTTIWGKVPGQQNTVYAFDNTPGTRRLQDVGLNGLSSEEERSGRFPAYANFLDRLRTKLAPETVALMEADPFSPLNDPAGDDYRYFRGQAYDNAQAGILARYKRYNGTEGNSMSSEDSPESFDVSSKVVPDVEDLNQDNNLNKSEKYYEYKVSLRPADMEVGKNYIVNKRVVSDLKLPNGKTDEVTWYQFKIPVREFLRRVGAIQDFKTIRFMRVYMTGFKEETVLRFGTFSLVSGQWRAYTQPLAAPGGIPSAGQLDVMAVSYEEDGDRQPINYVLPPGVSRATDPGQSQIVQQNEQSLSLKVTDLGSQDARAIYKNVSYDMRRYKRIQLFVHAESPIDNVTNLENGELSVFMRLGSDYKNNYYEYEVPLTLTPHQSRRNDDNFRSMVWPTENMIDFDMNILTDLKLKRNQARREGRSGVAYHTVFSAYDPQNSRNKISIIGNPSLSEVKTIMIGVRNNSKDAKTGEVWINELRMTDFDEEGGWAANANLNVALSDLGTLSASGRIETAGFGSLDQSLGERNLDNYSQYTLGASVQLGKFFPAKANISLPLYYAYSKETISPKYNPIDQDIILNEALDMATSKAEKDSIKRFSQTQTTTKSLAMNNINIGIRSKNSMPYDPANFTFSYASSENRRTDPETVYETVKNTQAGMTYNYTPYVRPFTPFASIAKDNGYTRYLRQLSLNYLPSNLNFQSTILRNYSEMQLRDLNNLNSGISNSIKPTFSEAFYFNRTFGIRWNPLNTLNIEFQSRTDARIEAPHVQVNRALEPDSFKVWQDAVIRSIRDLGSPLLYDQTVNVTYNLPLQFIPVLDWINASATYNALYNWERGSYIDTETEFGNTIKNQRQFNLQGGLNMQTLYNKNKFLKEIYQKFNVNTTAAAREVRRSEREKRKSVKYEQIVTLSPDSGVIVTHNLLTKNVNVRARRTADSSTYRLQFKVLDFARIRILNRDSAEIKVAVHPGPPPTENFLYRAAEYSARFLIMLRRVNVQYSVSDGMMLPGFQPTVGDWLGQARTPHGSAPGWGFALGDVSESYVVDARNKNWIVNNSSGNNTPAMINSSKTFTATATIEPAAGLKIDLNATRVDSRDTEIQHMFPNMRTTYGGTFTMTTVAIGSLFSDIGDARNGYASATFDRFLQNRNTIAARYERLYDGLPGSALANSAGVRQNSSDVLIPAFLAAYSGRSASKVDLSPFPLLSRLLPNWRISYDGLIQLPFIRRHFKSMVLNHQYRCTYNVGGYNSFANWESAGNGLGFVKSAIDDAVYASSPYDIPSVSIIETLSPLIGIDATFLNNVTAGAKIQRTRNLNLNTSSFQLIETHSDELVVSLGYKYADFNRVLKMKKKGDFNHDLTVRFDFSNRRNRSLIRKIEDRFTQMTQGAAIRSLQLSADYGISKSVTIRAFYDLQINEPLVSSTSYPTSNSNYGVSLRLSLAQ